MSPEAQRIAIAEACGWTREYADVPTWNAELNDYKGGYEPIHTRVFRRKEKGVLTENLPDYLNNLNAMHEAEKVLLTKDGFCGCWETYSNILTASMGCTDIFHATAAQRAKAFLRTIGKWEETSK